MSRRYAPALTNDDASLKQYRVPDWFRDAKFGIWPALGPAGRAARRRLVCAQYVYPGPAAIPASSGALRSPVQGRLQGHHSVVEGGTLRSGRADADGAIRSVHLLGDKSALTWTQRDDVLAVTLPKRLPTAHAAALKIELAAPATKTAGL